MKKIDDLGVKTTTIFGNIQPYIVGIYWVYPLLKGFLVGTTHGCWGVYQDPILPQPVSIQEDIAALRLELNELRAAKGLPALGSKENLFCRWKRSS